MAVETVINNNVEPSKLVSILTKLKFIKKENPNQGEINKAIKDYMLSKNRTVISLAACKEVIVNENKDVKLQKKEPIIENKAEPRVDSNSEENKEVETNTTVTQSKKHKKHKKHKKNM